MPPPEPLDDVMHPARTQTAPPAPHPSLLPTANRKLPPLVPLESPEAIHTFPADPIVVHPL